MSLVWAAESPHKTMFLSDNATGTKHTPHERLRLASDVIALFDCFRMRLEALLSKFRIDFKYCHKPVLLSYYIEYVHFQLLILI
ncbi:hypothetical protein L596_000993 [Steinernema carpocapsae]|uniref:Uncharacterized protein n=1 Tax=Steinernema carpocapsae TaxID=34508 RepID=A0A4U8UKH0_STECR|nr:hypothetical protein L596_000993 [Steinernema carpocapsae]